MTATQERGICHISDRGCTAPAGWRSGVGYSTNHYTYVTAKCYQCGEFVCRNCAVTRKIKGRWRRVCQHCVEEE